MRLAPLEDATPRLPAGGPGPARPGFHRLHGERLFEPGLPIRVGTYDHRPENMGWHDHDFWELAFVLEGKGWHRTLEHQRRLVRGDVYLLPPGAPHLWVAETRHRVVNLMFDQAWLSRVFGEPMRGTGPIPMPAFLEGAHPRMQALAPGAALFLRRFLGDLEREFRERQAQHTRVLECRFIELWIHLERFLDDHRMEKLDARESETPGHVETVRQYVLQQYREPLRLPELAKRVGVNPSYLSRIFHRETGYPLFEYLSQVRVEKACRLLRETQLPISSLALDVGFGSLAFFNRVFRRSTGVTPTAYRERHRPERRTG